MRNPFRRRPVEATINIDLPIPVELQGLPDEEIIRRLDEMGVMQALKQRMHAELFVQGFDVKPDETTLTSSLGDGPVKPPRVKFRKRPR